MITTGPGLMRPIATASTNCDSVSQWWSSTSPWWRKGTIASPEPKVRAPALAKNTPMAPSEAPEPLRARPLTVASRAVGDTARRARAEAGEPATVVERAEESGGEEEPEDLGAGDCGGCAEDRRDFPEGRVVLVGRAGELDSGDRDDRHHRRPDAEEDPLDPGQPLV